MMLMTVLMLMALMMMTIIIIITAAAALGKTCVPIQMPPYTAFCSLQENKIGS